MNFFECCNCSNKLRTRKGIIRHLKKCMERIKKRLADSPKERFSCEHCPKQFISITGLRKHLYKNHSAPRLRIPKEKSIKCNYCSATFATINGRTLHSKKHPEYNSKRDQLMSRRLYNCIFCGKTFTTKYYRIQHEGICMKKSSTIASSSMSDVNVTEFHLQESSPDEYPENRCLSTNTLPFQLQSTWNSLGTPQFEINVDESLNYTSRDSINITPKQQRYLRDRKTFLKLSSPDMSTSRRSMLNLQYGQQTVKKYQKQVVTLQQKVRRLQDRVKTFKDLLHHLEEQNHTFLN